MFSVSGFNDIVDCPGCGMSMSKLELNTHYVELHDPSRGVCVECLQPVAKEKLANHLKFAHIQKLGKLNL